MILFGSAVLGVLVVTLAYAVWSGQYEAAQPSPSPSAAVSLAPGASPSAAASVVASPSVEAEPTAGPSGLAATVTIVSSIFGPDLEVAAGTSVTFVNRDDIPHTATQGSGGVAEPDPLFNLQLPGGGTDSFTFADPGSYAVTCTIHPQMGMTITVE
jgi:plastocyanin